MKPLRNYRPGINKADGFFYEPWLLKELAVKQYQPFVTQINLEEHRETYRLAVQCNKVKPEACSIKVEFPYLYIRIQRREEREKLFGFIYLQPILHLFARHFLIPENVDTENISYNYGAQGLIIYLPKYYSG